MTTTTPGRHTYIGNTWLGTLWIFTTISAIVGVLLTSPNSDPAALDYNPTHFALGLAVLGIAGMLLTGLLVAGAVCWQIRNR